jgi:ADP-ribosylglycohydrolase
MAELDDLPATEHWASGATSDDTALTLLVAEHLAGAGGLGEPTRFLEALAARGPTIPGLGPSTTRAIEHFVAHNTADDSGSNTNGAPMRALPIGWCVPVPADARRRKWTKALTSMTHTGREAVTAACVMSACAAWAIEGAQPELLLEVGALEAGVVDSDTKVARALTAVRDRVWVPPADGITLDPSETVAAVLYACGSSNGLADALHRVVSLGGDTDTVAALVGGLLGCQMAPSKVRSQLAWLDRVKVPERKRVADLAASLASIRLTHDG